MAWNRNITIFEAGSTAEIDVNVIFTSTFVGLAMWYGRKNQNWRVAMEPEMELSSKPEDRGTDHRDKRTAKANDSWADSVTGWMKEVVEAIAKVQGEEWVSSDHIASLEALRKRVEQVKIGDKTEAQRRVCCNLLLDAFTWHKGDADRLVDTLKIGKAPMENCDGSHWWWDTDKKITLDNCSNPYTDEQLRGFSDLSALKR